MAKQGACHRFEARGKSPVAGPDAELPVPVEDPFEQDAAPCRVDRDAARAVVVRGRTPTAKDPGRGPLTLRLRDQALAFAKSDVIAARRRARRNPRLFLSELAAVVRELPVVLGYASLAEEFTIRGLALGEGPVRAFESRL